MLVLTYSMAKRKIAEEKENSEPDEKDYPSKKRSVISISDSIYNNNLCGFGMHFG